ncbi:MAG: cation transporter [Desulfosarcina sp.]|nr:cation transporter [Desulfobacterales bacterium]
MVERTHQRQRIMAAGSALVVGAALLAAKFYAYRLTGSSAVLSDALESIINVVASAFAIVSVVMAAKPPDPSHPYGHGKIEFFSAGFEGALIVLAAFAIFKAGLAHLLDPRPLPRLEAGLAVMVGASVVNVILGMVLIRVGKQTRSITLEADGRHVLTDVYTSIGVIIGLVLVRVTDWYWMDGLAACIVGINILITGSRLIRQSYHGLMDAADPAILDRIAAVIAAHRRPVWIDIHKLRAWSAGSRIHIDLHLILPRRMSLADAHEEADALEKIILKEVEGAASVLVHMDPCGGDYCPICGRKDCQHRKHEFVRKNQWHTEGLIASGAMTPEGRKPQRS